MLKQLRLVEIDEQAPKCFVCAKNSRNRLPYFLEYYRKLGVGTFFFADNDSSDGTREYLLEQDDVVLYWTDDSYQEANAGRAWTDDMLRRYGRESWCLTLDIDEFLLFPFCESVGLQNFCRYLEERGFEGVFTVMLDCYPRGELDQAEYRPGDSVFEVAQCYDNVQSYVVHPDTYFPFVNVRGGVRRRVFALSDSETAGPPQKKIPLVRNHEGFSYLYSTHGSTAVKLADVTGVLGHFKFFADTAKYVDAEFKGRDRKNPADYKRYCHGMRKHSTLFSEQCSTSFQDSVALLEQGFLATSRPYLDFVYRAVEEDPSETPGKQIQAYLKLHDRKHHNVVGLKDFIAAWPLLSALQSDLDREEVHEMAHQYLDALHYVDGRKRDPSLKITWPLRRWLRRKKWVTAKSLPELMGADFTLKERIKFTYDSFWWDVSTPVRLVLGAVDLIRLKLGR